MIYHVHNTPIQHSATLEHYIIVSVMQYDCDDAYESLVLLQSCS